MEQYERSHPDSGGKVQERRWLTAGELADLYGISVYSVRRAIRAGRLRTSEVMPGLIRIDRESVPEGQFSSRRPA